MTCSTRRLWLWLPAALLLAFSLLVLLGAEGTGSKVFYGVMASIATVWLVRSWRARIEINEAGITIHGQSRTSRFPWESLRCAYAEPMRTASPFRSRWPYVALTLEFANGPRKQFEEISAAETNRAVIDDVVHQINAHIAHK